MLPLYYDCYGTEIDGVRGTVYKLSDPISDDDRRDVEESDNARLLKVGPEYAPEIRRDAVFIAD